MPSLNARIHENYGLYTTSEKKIADALLQSPEIVKSLSIQELSDYCKVSTATITRFSHKNNYQGFTDLRLSIPNSVKQSSSAGGVVEKVISYYKQNIQHSVELIDPQKIEQLTLDIKTKKTIYIWGLGSSGRTASEFEQTLLRMGLLVKSVTDPHMLLVAATQITKDDLVIIISISGTSHEIIHAKSLLNKDCTTVTLSSNPNSQLAKEANYQLIISDIRLNNKYFVNFQLSLIFLIDCIAESLLTDETLLASFDKTVALLTNKDYLND